MNVPTMLKRALGQLDRERTRIDRQIASLQLALNGTGARSTAKPTPRKRRGMSTAARRAVGRRMKAYWAKRRAGTGKGAKKR